MEKHGIGTDASIPTHINNICQRNYVRVEGGQRRLVPTKLGKKERKKHKIFISKNKIIYLNIGIALVHGYHRIDPELVLPSVRAHVEKNMDFIAKGSSDPVHVTSQLLQIFFQKFQYFVGHVSDIQTYPNLH